MLTRAAPLYHEQDWQRNTVFRGFGTGAPDPLGSLGADLGESLGETLGESRLRSFVPGAFADGSGSEKSATETAEDSKKTRWVRGWVVCT